MRDDEFAKVAVDAALRFLPGWTSPLCVFAPWREAYRNWRPHSRSAGIYGIKPFSKATSCTSRGASRMSNMNPFTSSVQINGWSSIRLGSVVRDKVEAPTDVAQQRSMEFKEQKGFLGCQQHRRSPCFWGDRNLGIAFYTVAIRASKYLTGLETRGNVTKADDR